MKRLLVILILAALTLAPAFAERRWLIQTSDNKIIGVTDDDNVEAPDAAFATLVAETVIRMADPPGATGVILSGGSWNGTTYTPPANILPVTDPTSDAYLVQTAAHAMLDVFDQALILMADYAYAWPHKNIEGARDGIHYMIVNAARVALNSTRSASNRVKFMEEAASWPTGVNGDPGQYIDAMGAASPSDMWSWVDISNTALPRINITNSSTGFADALNVEVAPSSDELIGRSWINVIP